MVLSDNTFYKNQNLKKYICKKREVQFKWIVLFIFIRDLKPTKWRFYFYKLSFFYPNKY